MSPNDDLSFPVQRPSSPPLDPATSDALRDIAGRLAAAQSDVDEMVRGSVVGVGDTLSSHLGEINAAINGAIGGIDNALVPHEGNIARALGRVTDNILTNVVSAESSLGMAGVAMPLDTNQMGFELNQSEGTDIVSRLMGMEPVHVAPEYAPPERTDLPVTYSPPPPPPASVPAAPVDGPERTAPGTPSPLAPPPPPAEYEPGITPAPETTPGPQSPSIPPPVAGVDCGIWTSQPWVQAIGPDGCYHTIRRHPGYPDPAPGHIFHYQGDIDACGVPTGMIMIRPDVPYGACAGGQSPPPVAPPLPPASPPCIPVCPPPPCGCHEPPSSPPTSPPAPPPEGPPTSPPPPQSPPPPPNPRYVPGPLFKSGDACSTIEAEARTMSVIFPRPGVGQTVDDSAASSVLRSAQTVANSLLDNLFSSEPAAGKAEARRTNWALAGDWLGGYSQAVAVYDMLDPTILPRPNEAWGLGVMIGAATKAESGSGIPTAYLTQGLTYCYQALNPQFIPSQAELDNLCVTGRISREQWRCFTHCHGNISELRTDILANMVPVPTPDGIVRLENIGKTDPTLTDLYWSQNGVTRDADKYPFRLLSQFVPGPADLVRFMVRDAFDPDVVTKGQLDKDFNQKFFGPLGPGGGSKAEMWAKAQGMTEEQFRFFWYSHWEYPPNTALYDMYHRLRPDRPEVAAWNQAVGQLAPGAPPGALGQAPVVMTKGDIRTVMEINDMAPAMVDAMLAISDHPITRTDAIDAYLAGIFTSEDLYHRFRDNGYSEADARTMVYIQEMKRARRNNNLTGQWSIRRTLRAYQDGVIDGDRAMLFLTPLVPDVQTRNEMLEFADMEVVATNKRMWIKSVRQGYFTGAYDDAECIEKLVGQGVPTRRAKELTDGYRADRMGRYREPSAKMVLGWLKYGVINVEDCWRRLERLGYKKPDIDRMTHQAIIEWSDRTEGRLDKQEKKVEKLSKSVKSAQKATEEQLAAKYADAIREQKRLADVLASVTKELTDRGLPLP